MFGGLLKLTLDSWSKMLILISINTFVGLAGGTCSSLELSPYIVQTMDFFSFWVTQVDECVSTRVEGSILECETCDTRGLRKLYTDQ